MRIIDRLVIENFGVLINADLDGFRDLNILIGPNNCGKTTVLESILKLGQIDHANNVVCGLCQDAINGQNPRITNPKRIRIQDDEKFLREKEVKLSFYFDEHGINSIMPNALNEAKQALANNKCNHDTGMIFNKTRNEWIELAHISPFCHDGLVTQFANEILFCPDDRLGNYRGHDFKDYINQKNFRGKQFNQWTTYLKDTVDDKLVDYHGSIDLVRSYTEKDFETSLSEQGSGVRSLSCVYADIIGSNNSHILIIDEPELGLNPMNIQTVLRFLLNESKRRQIFISTHDPTFVNPNYWYGQNNVSVFNYSPYKEGFVKVNINENNEDPEVFAGYLPHTVSMKRTHIYVEGSSDVYIFQVLLNKLFMQKFKDWAAQYNRVGIFHLGGDVWMHLINTIPKAPYRSLIVLDGDKKETATNVVENMKKFGGDFDRFELSIDIQNIKSILDDGKTAIYCLNRDKIENYLNIPANKLRSYNKKVDGPRYADQLVEVPEEFCTIFESAL